MNEEFAGSAKNRAGRLRVPSSKRFNQTNVEIPLSTDRNYTIERDDNLETLVARYLEGSRNQRIAAVEQAVAAIDALGAAAGPSQTALAHTALTRIGHAFERIVLTGPLQQQLCCKLAIQLARPHRARLPASLMRPIIEPLIAALKVVLRVGAPTTRDSAVEGLGALLRTCDRAEEYFRPITELADGYGDPEFNTSYRERLKRRRELVLAVAGQSTARKHFKKLVKAPLPVALDKIRAKTNLTPEQKSEDLQRTIYEYGDFLRTLPAIERQHVGPPLPWSMTELLRQGAKFVSIGDETDPRVVLAFARFQESVFRTIDVLVRRQGEGQQFDEVVARAVQDIPPALIGTPPVCNARVRATIATLRTAIRLVERTEGASATKDALIQLWGNLGASSMWSNLGIVEGCYRRLPYLVRARKHDELARPALTLLLRNLSSSDVGLLAMHRRLAAGSCFRQILINLAEDGRPDEVTTLLADPNVLLDPRMDRVPKGRVSALVMESVAFEKALLERTGSMFRAWSTLAASEQVVLTRILVIQMHTLARQSRELQRSQELTRVFISMPTLEMTEARRAQIVFDIVAALPADAAAAADVDLHRFVEHCGRKLRESGAGEDHVEDLPGYVLAMVSPHASGRTADAIARELDLSLRQERRKLAGKHSETPFDFSRQLYQVTLRGPNESIFQHLIPRLEKPGDRRLADFFARHVAEVRRTCEAVTDDRFDVDKLLPHVQRVVEELRTLRGPTLRKLREALEFYRELAANDDSIWNTLAGDTTSGGLEKLFLFHDSIAKETHIQVLVPSVRHRDPLTPIYRDRLVTIQSEVGQYLKLSVSEFKARTEAMQKARDAAAEINSMLSGQRGLQPPERVLLMAIVQRVRDIFHRTILWYCDAPRRLKEAGENIDKNKFWWLFASDPKDWPDLVAAVEKQLADVVTLELDQEKKSKRYRELEQGFAKEIEIRTLRGSAGKEPPQIPDQVAMFEALYVEWMSADLDVDAFKSSIGKEWSVWFKLLYATITDLRYASALLVFPCVWAIGMDLAGLHWLEGAGFLIIGGGLIAAAVRVFSIVLYRLLKGSRQKIATLFGRPTKTERRGYSFQSLLPRLAKLVAVPMALFVEFDHSYRFPLHGPSSVLFLLMVLSFLTTRFFVGREVNAHSRIEQLSPVERQHVRQIVAVALSQAFAMAVLFSMLFASSHVRWMEEDEEILKSMRSDVHTILQTFNGGTANASHGAEAVSPACERYPRFLGLLPREASLDLDTVARRLHIPLPPFTQGHMRLMFYPTIVLAWTALGLFVGVFLEGFLKGERLRVEE